MQIAVHHILEAAELGDAASRIGAARGAATSSGNITGYQQILRDLHSNSHLLFVIRMIMEMWKNHACLTLMAPTLNYFLGLAASAF